MGTKCQSSITVYRLPTEENQFQIPVAAKKWKLMFSTRYVYTEMAALCMYIYIYYIYTHTQKMELYYIYAAVLNGKRKPRQFCLIHLLFAHRANGCLLVVCLLTKKQTEVVHLQRD
jgi:hypothetical protein